MILADTSAWIEFDRATGSRIDERMVELITGGELLATTEPVVMEVLSGATNARDERDLADMLGGFAQLPFDVAADFAGAVAVYRRCRAAGVTPRGLIDCMICAVAIRREAAVLAADADFARIAEVVALKLDPASAI